MENKKSDKYSQAQSINFPSSSFPSLTHLQKQHPQTSQSRESMFLKYASSIIQVVNEDKMNRSQLSIDNNYQNALVQISDVDIYGPDSKMKSVEGKNYSYNHISQPGQVFKKKKDGRKMVVYNFTNFDTFISIIYKHFHATLATSIDTIKNYKILSKPPQPKNRLSVQSRSTDYTLIDEFRSKKYFQGIKQLHTLQTFKEGANILKGWVQFKILMFKNTALRQIKEEAQRQIYKEDFSPIIASKRQSVAQERFDLTDYQNDNSITHIQQLQESLNYTADHHFQMSKEFTTKTPHRFDYQDRSHVERVEKRSQNPLTQAKESIVAPYKAHLKGSKTFTKGKFLQEKTVNISEPKQLKFVESRRYLSTRTNLYELPLISDQDLRQNGPPPMSDFPLKPDQMGKSEPQLISENVQSILKSIEPIQNLELTKNIRQQTKINPKNDQMNMKSYFDNVREKYTNIGTESNKNYLQGSQTCKIKAKNQLVHTNSLQTQSNGFFIGNQDRKGPQRIDNYYFPGKSPYSSNNQKQIGKLTMPEYSRNVLDDVQKVDSVLGSYKKETIKTVSSQQGPQHLTQKVTQQVRIEESMVSNFKIPDEPSIKPVRNPIFPIKTDRNERPDRSNQPKMSDYMNFPQKKSPEPSQIQNPQKMRSKISIGISPPPRRSETSPSPSNININYKSNPNININTMNPRRNEVVRSPPQNTSNRPNSNFLQSPSNFQMNKPPTLQQFGSNIRNKEPVVRPESRERNIPSVNFGHNVYQINQPHPQLLQPVHPGQLARSGEPRMISQHQTNSPQPMVRPGSRMMSPQPNMEPNRRPSSRDVSNKKAAFFSPQISRDHYGIQPTNIRYTQDPNRQKVQHQQQTQRHPSIQQYMTPKASTPMQEYFTTPEPHQQHQNEQQRGSSKAINFNNRYYCVGTQRQPPQMTQIKRQSQPQIQKLQETKKMRPSHDRPHSSSRQSLDKLNVYSNFTPTESQIESQGLSNQMTSRSSSKMQRPKSMNEKIHITMKHR